MCRIFIPFPVQYMQEGSAEKDIVIQSQRIAFTAARKERRESLRPSHAM